MDNRPIVAVVGRPNVGKSTLFNKLAGKRISIVEDTPGVTRDRIFTEVEWLNKYFTLIDTGGIEPENDDIILTQMRNQAMLAMDMAHVIVFVVDGKSGITSADREVGLMLRKTNKPVILAVNKILGEDRVIVSPIAGTTRDAVDTYFEKGDQQYLLIDTAGIRRKSKVYERVEKFSVLRSMSAVSRADVVLIVIDATEGVTEQDTKVAGIAHDEGKACIFVINKWDLIEKDNKTLGNYTNEIRDMFPFMNYAPILFVSAKTNQRMNRILDTVDQVAAEHSKRISTSQLNDVIGEAVMLNQPPSDKGKRLKIYYGAQTGVKPPKITLYINNKELTHFSYQRYLENKIRENFGFEGTSMQFEYKEKDRKR